MAIKVYPENNAVTYADSTNLDAFSRLRSSEPYGVADVKQISSNESGKFEESITGSGTATYQYNRSSTYLSNTTANGDRVIRQTVRYYPYIPGKSHLITMTGVFGAGKANVDQYIGYGDDLNGLFFKLQGTTFGIVTRTAVSGSAVDTFIAQSSWNVDTLDGSGPSGVTLDITKAQIFIIDFQWLGVGRVRFALDIDGVIVPVHEMNNANTATSVYMKTPTLPVRYEIHNTGAAASATTLEQICFSVASEGGYTLPGIEFSHGNGITRRAVTTRTPIFAIRLKAAFPTGQPNRKTARYLSVNGSSITNDAYFEVAHIHSPSAITATWVSAGADSAIEYSTDITAVTGNPEHVIDNITAISGLAGVAGQAALTSEFITEHSFISQNFGSTNSQMFVVFATSYSATANVSANLSWIEFV